MHISPITLIYNQGEPPQSSGFWQKAKNVLTLRICDNWQDNILIATVAVQVICVVLCLFSGQWMFGLVYFSSAAFLSSIRNSLREFTNLHGVTTKLHDTKEGIGLQTVSLSNRIEDLQAQNASFKAQLTKLEQERNKFKESNEHYADLNHTHLKLIKQMKEESHVVTDTLESLIKKGAKIGSAQKQAYLEAAKNFDELFKTGLSLQQYQESGIKNFINKFSEFLGSSDSQQKEMARNLGELSQKSKHWEQDRAKWETERKELAKEIGTLKETNKNLHRLVEELGKGLVEINKAASNTNENSAEIKNVLQQVSTIAKNIIFKTGAPDAGKHYLLETSPNQTATAV